MQHDLNRIALCVSPQASLQPADAYALIAVDNNAPIEEDDALDDNSIVDGVLWNENASAEAEDEDEPAPVPVTAASASASLSNVIAFFEQSSADRNVEISQLRAMLDSIEVARTQSLRQASIRSFFS